MRRWGERARLRRPLPVGSEVYKDLSRCPGLMVFSQGPQKLKIGHQEIAGVFAGVSSAL